MLSWGNSAPHPGRADQSVDGAPADGEGGEIADQSIETVTAGRDQGNAEGGEHDDCIRELTGGKHRVGGTPRQVTRPLEPATTRPRGWLLASRRDPHDNVHSHHLAIRIP